MPAEDILTASPPPADMRARYGEDPEHFADVYFAREKSQAALAINIHGGYWRAQYDLAHAGAFCAALAKRGVNIANVEYRRVRTVPDRPSWPRTFGDVCAAYQFLTAHASEWGIAASPVVVIGHSAGAQLAFCLAAEESSVGACVSLAGVLDLRRAWQLHLSNDAVVDYLGGTPGQAPEPYRAASPMELRISGRQLVVHGEADDVVPAAMSRDYAETKRKQGERVELLLLPNADHFDVINPASRPFKTVADAVLCLTY